MIAPLRKHTIIILSLVTVLFFVCNACGGGGVSSGGFGGGGNGGNSSPTISTFAGNGTSGYTGDGGLATAATINGPYGVSVDVHGNVYITDTGNSVVRKVDTTGKITTIAGNGSQGFSGDGGPAISASLYAPLRAVADSAGNVYIADSFNNRIRKVDSSGKISTFAGLGTQNFSGDGGQANAAELNLPGAIAVDSTGNVFICDTWNHRIRKVDSSGVITTVVGTGFPGVLGDGGQAAAAQLNEPEDVAVDSHGNIYIADTANSKIRKVDTSGVISTIAGNSNFGYGGDNGPGPSATLNEPTGVTVASSGNVYVADFLNNRIRKISTSGTITTFAGNGTSGFSGDGGAPASATISLPKEVAVDASESLYIADSNNMRIRRVH
jgi:sugar lactone lactonase YvrE